MINNINVTWLKRDLRLHDNAAFAQAATLGATFALYIIEPELWKLPDSSPRHWHFIHDSLLDLQRELGDFLIIRIGDATQVLEQLRHEIGIFSLFSHQESGNDWTFKRDVEVAKWCNLNAIKWHEAQSNGVVRRLQNRDGWAGLRDAYMNKPLIAPPNNLQQITNLPASTPLPAKNHAMFGDANIGWVQVGGRKEGLRTLDSFLRERGRKYMQTISKAGVSARYCSRLSAHITYGTLCVREIEQATKAKIKSLQQNPDPDAIFFVRNLTAFLSRLAWHCHFIQKLEQQPAIEFKCMHPAFEGMREPHFRQDFFEAWKVGQTGYPLVDACMRSLHENGWLNFRMRAMVVSFASYHLWLDWRQTAPYLAQLFTDYEAGIHYSQFQMQSGVTGINAIRMYNPIKQSYDNDAQGKFIRRYVPELKDIGDNFIHEPWRLDEAINCYPKPIVQHDVAIKHARAEIGKRWKSEGFREESRAVNEKLGSRNKQRMVAKKPEKKDVRQMSFDL